MPPDGTLPNSLLAVPCWPGVPVRSPASCWVPPPHGCGASWPDMLLICSPPISPARRHPNGPPRHTGLRTRAMAAITRRNPRKTLDTQGRGDDSFMGSKIITAVAAAVGVSLAAAACSTAATSSRAMPAGRARTAVWSMRPEGLGPPRGTAARRAAIGPPADARRTFGSGCRILHRGGPGSEAPLATAPLATAPLATALSRAPGLSELARAIQRSGLTQMLDAARALTVFATVAGTKLYLAPSDHSAGVNNATVTCGNVRTSNATVYVVDRLIVPGS